MIRAIPLTVLPLIAYNLVGYSLSGADPWGLELFSVTLLSGEVWSMRLGDGLIVFAIATLLLDVIRTAAEGRSAVRHMLSIVVLAVYVVEFVAAGVAAHSVFFVLMALAVFDVVAGFSISIGVRQTGLAHDADEDP